MRENPRPPNRGQQHEKHCTRGVCCAALGRHAPLARTPAQASGPTLTQVKEQGASSTAASARVWPGFGIPRCPGQLESASTSTSAAAIAAAIFDDPMQGQVRAALAKDRFTALQSGESRPAVAQHDLDDVARHLARAELRRHQLSMTARASWCARSSASIPR
jgi:hypothetical protein